MLSTSIGKKLVPILQRDCRRVLKMRAPNFPKPYYCSFLLRDVEWFNTWSASGSVFRRASDHTRNLLVDMRVGSYRYDQITQGGLYDNDDEADSYPYVRLPIDNGDFDGLRVTIWRLCEAKFREAVGDYSERRASGIANVDTNKRYPSFTKHKAEKHIDYGKRLSFDEEMWMRFCKRNSRWLSELPNVTSNWVEVDFAQETRIFVNTEGSVIVQPQQIFSLIGGVRRLTKSGLQLEQEFVFHATHPNELPSQASFRRQMLKKYEQLDELTSAKKIHSFSGPVLLYPKPGGLLFHEAIGHRLEGSRLLSSGEGQTFKGQIGKEVLNIPVMVRDNPTRKKFDGRGLIGAYEYDDEGTPSQDTLLIEDGKLRDFLTTRSVCLDKRGYESNGHARSKRHQRAISRMGVTEIHATEDAGLSLKEMRERLVEEIKRQKKPFGMIVYETSSGETDTTSFDFQAFSGHISYATLVYPNGKEKAIRGVDFVGTPLQALNNIVAIGSEQEIENHYCGAESGFLPVSTISPAILLSNLELQRKEEELLTQFILPKPRSSGS